MTERELIQQQQELGDSRFLVTRSGKFFSAYGCGAFALARPQATVSCTGSVKAEILC